MNELDVLPIVFLLWGEELLFFLFVWADFWLCMMLTTLQTDHELEERLLFVDVDPESPRFVSQDEQP